MRLGLGLGLGLGLLMAGPVEGQRLLEEWQVRPTAGAEAVVTGAAAVFWNPAGVSVRGGRAEALVLDLRAPGITGVDGVAAAASIVLDARTTLALGYEHVGVSGIEQTTDSPEGGIELSLAEDRFLAAASRKLTGGTQVGALLRYTRLPQSLTESSGLPESVIGLGAGVRHRLAGPVPLVLAGMAATEGDDLHWMAGVEVMAPRTWSGWGAGAEYGVTWGQLAPGATHRVVAQATWQGLVEVTGGVVVEPDGSGRSIQPVGGTALRWNRYSLGAVREQLPNEFGGAWSFRFSVVIGEMENGDEGER